MGDHCLSFGHPVGLKAMRFALGKPGLRDEEVIMKFNYRLAQERVKLAIVVVKLATASIYFAVAVQVLLSVASNYLFRSCPWVVIKGGSVSLK